MDSVRHPIAKEFIKGEQCPAETNEDAAQGSGDAAISGYSAFYEHSSVSINFHLSEESFEWLYREHLRTGLEPDDVAARRRDPCPEGLV